MDVCPCDQGDTSRVSGHGGVISDDEMLSNKIYSIICEIVNIANTVSITADHTDTIYAKLINHIHSSSRKSAIQYTIQHSINLSVTDVLDWVLDTYNEGNGWDECIKEALTSTQLGVAGCLDSVSVLQQHGYIEDDYVDTLIVDALHVNECDEFDLFVRYVESRGDMKNEIINYALYSMSGCGQSIKVIIGHLKRLLVTWHIDVDVLVELIVSLLEDANVSDDDEEVVFFNDDHEDVIYHIINTDQGDEIQRRVSLMGDRLAAKQIDYVLGV